MFVDWRVVNLKGNMCPLTILVGGVNCLRFSVDWEVLEVFIVVLEVSIGALKEEAAADMKETKRWGEKKLGMVRFER